MLPEVRRLSFAVLAILLVAGLTGCGLFGSDESTPETLTGNWEGTFTAQGTEYQIGMELQQLEGASTIFGGQKVQGGGTLTSGSSEYAFNVDGTVADTVVSMNLNYGSRRPGNLINGSITDDFSTIRNAEMTGGPIELDGIVVTLRRE